MLSTQKLRRFRRPRARMISAPGSIEYVAGTLSRSYKNSTDLGIINLAYEVHADCAVGHADRNHDVVRRIFADLGIEVEVADDRLAVHSHVENALAGRREVGLGEFQGYRVVTVCNRNAIGKIAVSFLLVQGVLGCAADGRGRGSDRSAAIPSVGQIGDPCRARVLGTAAVNRKGGAAGAGDSRCCCRCYLDGAHLGVVHLGYEADADGAVGDVHRNHDIVGYVLADLGEDVQVADDRLPVDRHVENPLAGGREVEFGELERYRVAPVRDRDAVGEIPVSFALVERPFRGAADGRGCGADVSAAVPAVCQVGDPLRACVLCATAVDRKGGAPGCAGGAGREARGDRVVRVYVAEAVRGDRTDRHAVHRHCGDFVTGRGSDGVRLAGSGGNRRGSRGGYGPAGSG